MVKCCIVVFLLLTCTSVECSKILFIAAVTARSHYNVFVPLIEELANRKHDITVQSRFSLQTPRPNVKELMLPKIEETHNPEEIKDLVLATLKMGAIVQMKILAAFMKSFCEPYLNDSTTKALLTPGLQYDVVIIDTFFGDCQAAVGSLTGKHVINVYTNSYFPWQVTSAPTPPSYIPNPLGLLPSKMDFLQRLENAVTLFVARFIYQYESQAHHQYLLSQMLPQAGTLEKIEEKAAFSITNGDPVVTSARPTMPNIVHCGGMHIGEAKPLPKELNDFVENSGDSGFIIFGLGSNVKSEYLSPEVVRDILSAFSRLRQNVIWKFERKLQNLPKNVKVIDWMPQLDLLAHPKARLFITHSGLLSLQEAIYHAVPVIGMPFFGDQRGNIIRLRELGVAEYYDFLNLTADGFYEMISTVLNGKSYYENMKKYSAIFKDQPDRPVDRAVFWIEYVIRHDGARHLRSAGEDLNFFQYYLLDVVGSLLVVSSIVVGLLVYFVKFLLRKLFRRNKLKKNLDKKRK